MTKRAFTALTSAIAPEATVADIAVSEEVCTDMPTLPEVHCPIVKPAVVMVNAEALMTAPEVVITNTPLMLPPVAAPNLNPCRMTVTVELAAIDPPAVVMTMEVALGALMAVKLMPLIETVPLGVLLEAKKPDG